MERERKKGLSEFKSTTWNIYLNGTQISLVDRTELSQKSSTKTLMFEEV